LRFSRRGERAANEKRSEATKEPPRTEGGLFGTTGVASIDAAPDKPYDHSNRIDAIDAKASFQCLDPNRQRDADLPSGAILKDPASAAYLLSPA